MRVPFIDADMRSDIRLLLFLLPLWFILGVDQFVWPPMAVWFALRWRFGRRKVTRRRDLLFRVAGAFAIAYLWSALSIDNPVRILTFVRNFMVYLGGMLLAYVVFQSHRTREDTRTTIRWLVALGCVVTVSGLLPVFGMNLSFTSILGRFVPLSMRHGYLSDILEKSLLQAEANWFSEGFNRPSGLMMYPNTLTGAILLLVPLKLYFVVSGRSGKWTWPLLATLPADGLVVIYTLSRSGWGAAVIAAAGLFVLGRFNIRHRTSLIAVAVMVVGVFIYAGGADIMMSRVMAKTHSNAERELDYALTWAHITSTPWLFLFGQGTQIDVPQLRIPLGSHSTFLGLWFKQGLLGLLLFYAMGSRAVLASRLALFETRDQDDRWFARMVMTSTVFTLCQGAFVEIDVDASYCALWWVIVGLSLAHLSMLREEREDLPVAPDRVAEAVRGRLPVGPRPLPAPGYSAFPRRA